MCTRACVYAYVRVSVCVRVSACMCVYVCACVRTYACVYVRREGRNHTSEQTFQVFVAALYDRKVFHLYIMTIS